MSHIDPDCAGGEFLPYLTANASGAACFEFRESKDAEVQEFSVVRGSILGAWRGNSCWQYPGGPFPGRKVVCKAHDAAQPAQLAKDLTENESALIESQGWTGDCSTCGLGDRLRNFDGTGKAYPGFKPEQHIPFLWDSPTGPKPVLLNFKGWKGFLAMKAFNSRFNGRNPHDFIIEITMKKVREGENTFGVPVPKEIGPVPAEIRDEMAMLADLHVTGSRYRPIAARPALSADAPRGLPAPAKRPPPVEVIDSDDIPF